MYRSGQRVVTQAIQKYLGSSYDVVKTVYDNLTLLLGLQNLTDNADKVVDVADNLDDVTSVADNLTDVSAVADNIVAITEVSDLLNTLILDKVTFTSTEDFADGVTTLGTLSDADVLALQAAGTPIETIGFYPGSTTGSAKYKFLNLADSTAQGYVTGYSRFQIRSLDVYACLVVEGVVYASRFGVTTGVDSTTEAQHAYDFAAAQGVNLYFGSGTYLLNLVCNKGITVYGFYKGMTIIKPTITDGDCITFTSLDSTSLTGASLKHITVKSDTSSEGRGIVCGGSGAGEVGILKQGEIKDVAVDGFDTGVYVSAMLTYTFNTVLIENCGTYGLYAKEEGPNTTNTFVQMRIRQCSIGALLRSMQASSFTNCNFESNKYLGVDINGSTTNTTTLLTFDTCWFENNGYDPVAGGGSVGTGAGIRFDFNAAVASTFVHNISLNRCIFSSPSGERDIRIERGVHIDFYKCAFTEFNPTKLSFSTGTGITSCFMHQCSKYKEKPTAAMYTSFPALYSNNTKGIFYSFVDESGREYTNRPLSQVITIDHTVPPTGLDCNGIETVICDTSGGSITLTSLSGVKEGQVIRFVKESSSNTLTFTHSAASQGFLNPTGANLVVSNRSVTTYVNNGLAHYKDE